MISNPKNHFHNNCLMVLLYTINLEKERNKSDYINALERQANLDPRFRFQAEYQKRNLNVRLAEPASKEWVDMLYSIFQLAISQPLEKIPYEENPWPVYASVIVMPWIGPVDRQITACEKLIGRLNDVN